MCRFKQGQEIYVIEVHNNQPIGINKREVFSCGKKILKLKGNHENDFYRLAFSEAGLIGNKIERFHSTKESAELSITKFNNNI